MLNVLSHMWILAFSVYIWAISHGTGSLTIRREKRKEALRKQRDGDNIYIYIYMTWKTKKRPLCRYS